MRKLIKECYPCRSEEYTGNAKCTCEYAEVSMTKGELIELGLSLGLNYNEDRNYPSDIRAVFDGVNGQRFLFEIRRSRFRFQKMGYFQKYCDNNFRGRITDSNCCISNKVIYQVNLFTSSIE